MRTELKQGTLIEVFASEGKLLDLGDVVYTNYVCVPSNFDISTIKEITIDDVDTDTLIEKTKQEMLNKITKYDISKNVNEFYVNNISFWIPRETRVSLQNSTEILLKNGISTVTLWEGTMKFILPCEMLLHMLDELEIYALKCFNVTAEHKANIMNFNTIEDINNYDYTVNYPNKLTFTI